MEDAFWDKLEGHEDNDGFYERETNQRNNLDHGINLDEDDTLQDPLLSSNAKPITSTSFFSFLLSLFSSFSSSLNGPSSPSLVTSSSSPRFYRNLDHFFNSFYMYYYYKGSSNFYGLLMIQLVNVFFTLFISSFFLGCVNWNALSLCSHNCGDFSIYVSCSADWGVYKTLILFYFCLFFLYWIYLVYAYFYIHSPEIEFMSEFYKTKLRITTNMMQTMTWNEVITRLNEYQKISNLKTYPPHMIVARIMRRENYLIAMLNHYIKNKHDKISKETLEEGSQLNTNGLEYLIFSTFAEKQLRWLFLDPLFTDTNNWNSTFAINSRPLQSRIIFAGIISLLCAPFFLVFLLLSFLLKYAQEWHSEKQFLGPRQYSLLALWRFREYNELPHDFEQRIRLSIPAAHEYLSQFPSKWSIVILRCAMYISGALISILVLMSLIQERVLSEILLLNKPLLWYLTILTLIFSLCRNWIKDVSVSPATVSLLEATTCFAAGQIPSVPTTAEETMYQLSAHTHYFPEEWKNKCELEETRNQFSRYFFPFKIQLFLQEMLSVFVTPLIAIFIFPKYTDRLLSYLSKYTVQHPSIGAVVWHSYLVTEEGKATEKINQKDDADEIVRGKMEKSVLNFYEHYNDPRVSVMESTVIKDLNAFKEKEMNQSHIFQGNNHESLCLDTGIDRLGTPKLEHSLTNDSKLLSSAHFLSTLGQSFIGRQKIHENNFYWLEKYYQRQRQEGETIKEEGEEHEE